jgi:hypothetical protein
MKILPAAAAIGSKVNRKSGLINGEQMSVS